MTVDNIGMRVEEFLDLPRRDVLAAPDDEVFDPAGDPHVPGRVHLSQISGVHPAVGVDHLRSLLRVIPVPGHHRIASRAELADHPARDRLARGRIHHLDLKVWTHPTDRADPSIHRVVGARLRGNR
ncbi:Uncharacterised protein [Mycobacterium tuberculosis]|uniref:Uncharacterized protein n=1 Tax=Mycobacterium tuberculosis TaxID=1773 RepID=A0A654U5E7_MYCTX|nr:Uncharacterised protein [Mycobacterium tuberculosis]COW56461.1 Uncharacterised protein [Mycobacterium tuberculosis]